jgi:drug/metabolite transporter (DMT)-like permease
VKPAAPALRAADDPLILAMPWVFVVIWSTGFVVARLGMPHAPPLSFLALRFLFSILAFAVWITLARVPWPSGRAQWWHLGVTGVLMHAGYLGGVWAAVKAGLGAGMVALIVGLQPVLTAVWVSAIAPGGGSRADSPDGSRDGSRDSSQKGLRPQHWLGLVLGLMGLLLVVGHKLQQGQANAFNVGLGLLALLCITAGTLYQKRWVAPCDVRTGNTVQLMAALLVTAPLAWLETGHFEMHQDLVIAMAWSVFGLTLGGSSLLTLLIQRGAATTVTSMMYLVPPCTALMAWLLFNEPLGPWVLVGLLLSALGVALVVRQTPVPAPGAPVR